MEKYPSKTTRTIVYTLAGVLGWFAPNIYRYLQIPTVLHNFNMGFGSYLTMFLWYGFVALIAVIAGFAAYCFWKAFKQGKVRHQRTLDTIKDATPAQIARDYENNPPEMGAWMRPEKKQVSAEKAKKLLTDKSHHDRDLIKMKAEDGSVTYRRAHDNKCSCSRCEEFHAFVTGQVKCARCGETKRDNHAHVCGDETVERLTKQMHNDRIYGRSYLSSSHPGREAIVFTGDNREPDPYLKNPSDYKRVDTLG